MGDVVARRRHGGAFGPERDHTRQVGGRDSPVDQAIDIEISGGVPSTTIGPAGTREPRSPSSATSATICQSRAGTPLSLAWMSQAPPQGGSPIHVGRSPLAVALIDLYDEGVAGPVLEMESGRDGCRRRRAARGNGQCQRGEQSRERPALHDPRTFVDVGSLVKCGVDMRLSSH